MNKGFTLIEMLVAVAVFAAAATISAGALLSISDAQQKVLALRISQDNLGYALDTMGKEIRTGQNYHCASDISLVPQDCSGGGSSFTFLNAQGQTITYRITAQRLEKIVNGVSQYLTSPDFIIINFLGFYVVGAPASDNLQPRITIILQGTAGIKTKASSRINIQTTISQRALDS